MPILISSMPGDSLRVSSSCLTTLLGFRDFLKRTLKKVSLSRLFLIHNDWSCVAKATWIQFQSLEFGLLALRRHCKFWTSIYLLQDPKFFNLCTKNASQRHSFLYSFITPESCSTIHLNTKQTSLVSQYMGTQSELILFHRICGHRLNVIHRTRYNTKWMILMVLDMAQGVRLNPDDHNIVIWFVKLNLGCLKTMWVGLETLVGASLL
jgi:hypothetical protein